MSSEFIGFVLVAAIFGTVLIGGQVFKSYSCSSRASKMGKTSSYGPIQGCMIEYQPGFWVPIDQYRVNN